MYIDLKENFVKQLRKLHFLSVKAILQAINIVSMFHREDAENNLSISYSTYFTLTISSSMFAFLRVSVKEER